MRATGLHRAIALAIASVVICSCSSTDEPSNGQAADAGGPTDASGKPDAAPAGQDASTPSDASASADAAVELDTTICDPSKGPFSLTIDSPFLSYPVGKKWKFEGDEAGVAVALEITVLNATETVAGVTTRVVEERHTEDGELVEVSRNFFAQAPDGSVCYFGEDVDIYENGSVASHDGAWRTGGANKPGIIMPGKPAVGQSYQQEVAPGVAMDRAVIVTMGTSLTVPAGTYTDTLTTKESSPLDQGATSTKVYARGVGLILDEPLTLVSISP